MAQMQEVRGVATNIRYDKDTDEQIVRYHNTDVVKFDGNSVTLNSGGWRTNTTKTRMNQASNQFGLGYFVFQKDFEWFVKLNHGEVLEFSDGMNFPRA